VITVGHGSDVATIEIIDETTRARVRVRELSFYKASAIVGPRELRELARQALNLAAALELRGLAGPV
jgi:hypothetical protein